MQVHAQVHAQQNAELRHTQLITSSPPTQGGYHPNISTENQYDLLDLDDITCFMEPEIESSLDQNTNGKNFQQNNRQRVQKNISGNVPNTRAKNNSTPPPISVCNSNINIIVNALQKINITKGFTVKKLYEKHIVQTDNLDNYKLIKNVLDTEKTENYSPTPVQERKKNFLLRGFDGHENPDEIQNELINMNISNVKICKVQKFVSQNKNKIENCSLFQVQISPESDENQLFKVKNVNNIIVKWESIKQTQIAQCYRCQRMGHMASNCAMNYYRCVKCK